MSELRHQWPERLEIDPGVYLAPGAVVAGEVRIGARSSVWFHTVLRGDTERIEIGADTNLQDLTLVHVDPGLPAIVGDRVTVGHRAIVHGCVIGDDCLIGMGAIVLSGARIGAGSLIGAGALVREGQEIPAGSLALGAPARILGPVQDSHRAAIARGTRHYVALSREYLGRGFGQPVPARDSVLGALGTAPAPMTWSEWGACLGALGESPDLAAAWRAAAGEARWRRRPAADRWSAHDVVAHLIDGDAEVFAPRLDRLISETRPALEAVDLAARLHGVPPSPEPGEVLLARWSEARRRLLARLAPLGPADWARTGSHARLGPYSVATLVRAWVEHDRSHRHQIESAIGSAV